MKPHNLNGTQKFIAYSFVIFLAVVFWAFVASFLASCGSAKADGGVTATMFIAPDGSQCYAIMQNGSAVGGNCK